MIAYPGPDLSGSPLELRPAPTGRVTRSFQSALTVTGERVWLSAYSQLTMAAQFEDEPPMVSYTPWIAIPNGRYLVSVQQARTTFRKAVRVHIALEPIDPDSDEFTTGAALVPWFDDSGSLDAD